MSLISIKAAFNCDDCGRMFENDIDPNWKADDGFGLAIESLKSGVITKVTDDGKHLCKRCTREHDDYEDLKESLEELVALKDLKDEHGKTEDYQERQPLAWERARKLLNDIYACKS